MALYRRGVGRVRLTRGGSHPFEVSTGDARPHPGFCPSSGSALEAHVADRSELPGGLVVESYGAYKRSGGSPPAPEPKPVLEPEASPARPQPRENWRTGYGLMRNG